MRTTRTIPATDYTFPEPHRMISGITKRETMDESERVLGHRLPANCIVKLRRRFEDAWIVVDSSFAPRKALGQDGWIPVPPADGDAR